MSVVGAILVAWAGDRAKPLVLFPLVLGCVFGGIASLAAVWCELPRQRIAMLMIVIGAAALVPASYYVAAQRAMKSEKIANPLAEKLLKQMEQQSPAGPESISSTTAMENYLRRRYQRTDVMSCVMYVIGEGALAGVAAAAMMAILWRGRAEEPQA